MKIGEKLKPRCMRLLQKAKSSLIQFYLPNKIGLFRLLLRIYFTVFLFEVILLILTNVKTIVIFSICALCGVVLAMYTVAKKRVAKKKALKKESENYAKLANFYKQNPL